MGYAVTLAGIVDPEDIGAGQAEYERNCKRPHRALRRAEYRRAA
jgi:hypothetical protein